MRLLIYPSFAKTNSLEKDILVQYLDAQSKDLCTEGTFTEASILVHDTTFCPVQLFRVLSY
jgi:hypothetical protein